MGRFYLDLEILYYKQIFLKLSKLAIEMLTEFRCVIKIIMGNPNQRISGTYTN